MNAERSEFEATLEAKLSPTARAVLVEVDCNAELGQPHPQELLDRIDALPEQDRSVLSRLLRFRMQGAAAAQQSAERAAEQGVRALRAISRAAELEGIDDPTTITADEAFAILERHGEEV